MRPSKTLVVVVTLTATALLHSGMAVAQEAEDARSLFLRGLELADEERWGEAVDYFRRSRALEERASTVFNLGVALVRQSKYNEALEAFEDYVQLSDEGDPARAEARRLAATARASRARLELSVSPDDAVVRVDGVEVEGAGPVREVFLDPGRRILRVEAAAHETQVLTLSPLTGASLSTRVELVPAAGSSAAVETVPTALDSEDRRSAPDEAVQASPPGEADEGGGGGLLSNPLLWAVAAVVVVGAGVGVGLALSGQDEPPQPYGGTSGVVLLP